jgi:hypothetical protein
LNLLTISTATINMHDKFSIGEDGWRTYLNDRITSLRQLRKSTPEGIIITDVPGVECTQKRRDEVIALFNELVKNHQMPTATT